MKRIIEYIWENSPILLIVIIVGLIAIYIPFVYSTAIIIVIIIILIIIMRK